MSTNFYMITKNKKFADTYFPGEYETYDENAEFKAEIHIGKRSVGWCPLFRAHKNAYTSVKELRKFLVDHAEDMEIKNEYGEVFTPKELENELLTWKEQQKKYPDNNNWRYVPGGVVDEIFGGKKYLVPVNAGEPYDLESPIDHVAYAALDPNNEFRVILDKDNMYFHDEDGYNFTNRNFC